ncbi:methyltransferase domain-containing protein [Parendozoicomonas sp. Alg238-R29]|uniref:class I SAM-dependent methyltransferase n=1 Tax=Parendozoicomonas sp. Alg238-R29 TaxID=2993446 RepID=UPI00248EA67E|nr:methyltransferase domain-containing protein [Parendozoicomonas sp. Alg238-R29]
MTEPHNEVSANAEALPFKDASCDAAISTFGVMFTGHPEQAAHELSRVYKPGRRLVLTTRDANPSEYIGQFFALFSKYRDSPPPQPSPLEWRHLTRIYDVFNQYFYIRYQSSFGLRMDRSYLLIHGTRY